MSGLESGGLKNCVGSSPTACMYDFFLFALIINKIKNKKIRLNLCEIE